MEKKQPEVLLRGDLIQEDVQERMGINPIHGQKTNELGNYRRTEALYIYDGTGIRSEKSYKFWKGCGITRIYHKTMSILSEKIRNNGNFEEKNF